MQFRSLSLVAALAACLLVVSNASAANVNWTLEWNGTTNTFEIFAEAPAAADNFGIASYNLLLNGTIATLDHMSPNATFATGPGGAGPAGFTLFRSADNAATLGASQDTVAPTPNIIKGFGQSANSFAGLGMTPIVATTDPVAWDAKLLVASGTYTGANPTFNVESVEVFTNVFSAATGAATIQADDAFMVVEEGVGGNTPPSGVDALIDNVLAGPGVVINHQFTATDTETPAGPFTWSNLQFGGAPGFMGSGEEEFQPTLSPTGLFSWNTNGSARGIYSAMATVTDPGGLTDTATLTINVTAVPEPATLALCSLALVGIVGFIRRR